MPSIEADPAPSSGGTACDEIDERGAGAQVHHPELGPIAVELAAQHIPVEAAYPVCRSCAAFT